MKFFAKDQNEASSISDLPPVRTETSDNLYDETAEKRIYRLKN
jgi:hypothetical protein